MKDFKIINEFKGYSNKRDITNLDPRFLVSPSRNVIINDGEKISIRNGYSLLGSSNTALNPIISSYEWNTSTGSERSLRSVDDELQVYVNGDYRTLADGYTSADFSFTTIWDQNENLDLLIFVNGEPDLNMWSGGITTFASATSNTITKQGSTTWAEERFLKSGTRQVTIEGIVYTYTGGEGTDTLTGVTPDPTSGSHTAGDLVYQTPVVVADSPASGFSNDIVGTLRNQLYVGDYDRRDIYVSKNDDWSDFTFSTPRLPGEGAIVTADSTPVAFAPQEEAMYIATKDGWFETQFTLSSDLTNESLIIKRLKASRGKGAYAQQSVAKAGNDIAYFTNDRTIDLLGRVEEIDTPQSVPISDVIKDELLSYDVTVAPHIRYHDNNLYVAFPSEGKMLIYDFENRYWNPPQLLPIRRIAIIDNELYGHSSQVTESYRLFDPDVFSDNGNPIDARAAFAYRNYGLRAWKKVHDEWYTEIYKTPGTTVTLTLKYDFGGYTSILDKSIGNMEERFVFATESDGSLGKWPLGSQPLGSITDSVMDLEKVRVIHQYDAIDYYEIQTVYSSDDVDQRWALLATGGNVRASQSDNQDIKV